MIPTSPTPSTAFRCPIAAPSIRTCASRPSVAPVTIRTSLRLTGSNRLLIAGHSEAVRQMSVKLSQVYSLGLCLKSHHADPASERAAFHEDNSNLCKRTTNTHRPTAHSETRRQKMYDDFASSAILCDSNSFAMEAAAISSRDEIVAKECHRHNDDSLSEQPYSSDFQLTSSRLLPSSSNVLSPSVACPT